LGAQFSPQVLANQTQARIASVLTSPYSAIVQGVVGSAKTITAAICWLTNNKPSNVCTDTTIKKLEKELKAT
jgi:hypothetical protein